MSLGDGGYGDINFGAAGQDGVVALKKGNTVQADHAQTYLVNVQAGTLTAADDGSDLQTLLDNDAFTFVQSGATLDVNGITVTTPWLAGGGNITNSGAAAELALDNKIGRAHV